jgi:hypothetical protein
MAQLEQFEQGGNARCDHFCKVLTVKTLLHDSRTQNQVPYHVLLYQSAKVVSGK